MLEAESRDGAPSVRGAWSALPHWGRCWRLFLSVLLVCWLGLLILSVLGAVNGHRWRLPWLPGLPAALVLVPGGAAVLALLAWPLLRRVRPLAQAVLLGAVAGAIPVLALAPFILIKMKPCTPGVTCEGGPDLALAMVFVYGIPICAVTAAGYALAVWIARSPIGLRVFWVLFALSAAALWATWVFGGYGPDLALQPVDLEPRCRSFSSGRTDLPLCAPGISP